MARLRYPRYQDCRREERGAVSAVPRGQPLGLRVSTCPPPATLPVPQFPRLEPGGPGTASPRSPVPLRPASLRHVRCPPCHRPRRAATLCPRSAGMSPSPPLPAVPGPPPRCRVPLPGSPWHRARQQDGSRTSPPWSLLEATLTPCPPRAPHHCPTPRGDFGDVFTLPKAGMFPGARPLWGQRLSPAQGVAGLGVPPAPLPAPHRPPIVSGRPKSKFIPDDLMSGFRWQRDSSGASASLNPSRPRHT